METSQTDILYFDGQCPLCSREMAKLNQCKDESLQLVDIHQLDTLPAGKSREALLRDLHLEKSNGAWLTGLDANVAAWQHCKMGWSVRWMRWPLIAQIGRFIYRLWANRRYDKLYGSRCTSGQCDQSY